MNRITNAAAWLSARLADSAGDTITITRGETSVSVTATRRRAFQRIQDAEGLTQVVVADDFLVTVAELATAGLDPRPGDRIQATVGGVAVKWQLADQDDRPAVEWWDQAKTMLVLHTKRIEG